MHTHLLGSFLADVVRVTIEVMSIWSPIRPILKTAKRLLGFFGWRSSPFVIQMSEFVCAMWTQSSQIGYPKDTLWDTWFGILILRNKELKSGIWDCHLKPCSNIECTSCVRQPIVMHRLHGLPRVPPICGYTYRMITSVINPVSFQVSYEYSRRDLINIRWGEGGGGITSIVM